MNGKKEGKLMNVQDRPAELGIRVNNVLQALAIVVMLWVGSSILDIKEEVSGVRLDFAVGNVQLNQLRKEFDAHIAEKTADDKFDTRMKAHDNKR